MNRSYWTAFAVFALVLFAAALFALGFGHEMHVLTATGGMILAEGAPVATKEIEKQFNEAIASMKEANDGVKKLAETAQAQLKDAGALQQETRAAVDEALLKLTSMATQVNDLEQKLVQRREERRNQPSTPGAIFVTSDAMKGITSDRVQRGQVISAQVPHSSFAMDLPLGTPLAAISSGALSGGALVEEYRVPGLVELPQRRMTIRNLLAPGRTISNAFKYVKETGFTNNAAVVSEGTEKPESTMTFDVVTGNVATIAHWMNASKQILDDAPGLQSIIDNRLRYGLQLREEAQLLRGDGTGDNLLGIIPQASDYNGALIDVENETQIDEIRKAMLQVFLAEYPASGIVLHPTDWAAIELRKDTTGRYIIGNPQGRINPTLWGLPVVTTQAMNQDEFLVGSFNLAAQIFDREDANVAISNENKDNFTKNMVTILAEERLALAVYRPEAMVTGNFVQDT